MKSWRHYHKLLRKYQRYEYQLVCSLSPKTPYGRDPHTKKKYRSAETFTKALRQYERTWHRYLDLLKRAYKQQTGKNWGGR